MGFGDYRRGAEWTRAQETAVGVLTEFDDSVVAWTFVIAKTDVNLESAGGACNSKEMGDLHHGGVPENEVGAHERNGVTLAGPCWNRGKGVFLGGLALAVFTKTRAGVESQSKPIEDRSQSIHVGRGVEAGKGGDLSRQSGKKSVGERLFLLLWTTPGVLLCQDIG